MPGSFRPRERRFPLHVHISALFILLLLLAGSALGVFNYRQTTAVILSSSEALFARIQEDVREDVRATFQPIRRLLGVLHFAKGVQGQSLQARQALLPPFAQALRDNPKLAALYVGYQDGDFFMVRALRTAALREQFGAPANATVQIWSIERHNASQSGEYLFFDDNLNLLARRSLEDQGYDPRTREWYSRAQHDAGTITTTPYRFFSSGALGTTLATATSDQAVIAADLTLEDLSATLVKHKVTPGSEVLLFDAQGSVVAYPDNQRLLVAGAQPRLARVDELLAELSASLAELKPGEDRQGVEILHKRRWVVSRTHISEGGPTGLYLAQLVPEDELLADAYRIRWQSALVTLTALLLCLPLGWLASRCITRPLAALQKQAEAMGRFDFSTANGVRSSVQEVDSLALAMARMNRTLTRYQQLIAELGHQSSREAMLQWIARQTISAVQAQAGVIYLVENDCLQPRCLEFEGLGHAIRAADLDPLPTAQPLPVWLERALTLDSTSACMGFDKAGSLKPLLHSLGTPMVNLLAVALRGPEGNLLGLLVLFQELQPLDGGQGIHDEQCVAFSEAVAKIAAHHLQRRLGD